MVMEPPPGMFWATIVGLAGHVFAQVARDDAPQDVRAAAGRGADQQADPLALIVGLVGACRPRRRQRLAAMQRFATRRASTPRMLRLAAMRARSMRFLPSATSAPRGPLRLFFLFSAGAQILVRPAPTVTAADVRHPLRPVFFTGNRLPSSVVTNSVSRSNPPNAQLVGAFAGTTMAFEHLARRREHIDHRSGAAFGRAGGDDDVAVAVGAHPGGAAVRPAIVGAERVKCSSAIPSVPSSRIG